MSFIPGIKTVRIGPDESYTTVDAFSAFADLQRDIIKLQEDFIKIRRERDQYLDERNDARDEVNKLKSTVTGAKTGLAEIAVALADIRVRTAALAEDEYNRGWEEAAAKIAYDITAELVCCDVYERAETASKNEHWGHQICYWGAASAKIAKDVGERLR